MAKFKAGDAVKLRDDQNHYCLDNDTKYTVDVTDNSTGVHVDEENIWISEDALEAWPESAEERMSNEIDPQLLEIFKVIIGGFSANPSICYDHKGDIFLPIEPAINFAKESVRLLREENKLSSAPNEENTEA